jgi:hypothetical protein
MSLRPTEGLISVSGRHAGESGTSDDHPLSFLVQAPPPEYELREITVPAGRSRPYDEREWEDALVVIERGEIELECASGRRWCFERGAVLWLVGLALRAIHNHRREPAVLIAISRRPISRTQRRRTMPR